MVSIPKWHLTARFGLSVPLLSSMRLRLTAIRHFRMNNMSVSRFDIDAATFSIDLSVLVQAKDNVAKLFCTVSGLELNFGKTYAVFIAAYDFQNMV